MIAMSDWFVYPDKPTSSTHLVLPHLAEGEWLAQTKYDGWRCLVFLTPSRQLHFVSRENKPLPVSRDVRAIRRNRRHTPA